MNNDFLIEEYRTFQIWYSENEDVFYSELKDRYEMSREPTRRSLKDLKLEIDKHIKKNLEFKPFTTFLKDGHEKEIIKILNVKVDGGLIYEYTNPKNYHYGKKQHMSSESLHGKQYDGTPWPPKLFIINEHNQNVKEKIDHMTKMINKISKEQNDLEKTYEPLDLSFIEQFKKD